MELKRLAPTSVLDFGCGEAFLLDELLKRDVAFAGYTGLDAREGAIAEAYARHPAREFIAADIFDWPNDDRRFELVLASQVLEHLFEPERYLERLVRLASGRLLLTVPLEPWFQLMNLMRGRDFIRLGNHPEHINHWSEETFADFVGTQAEVKRAWTVFPFVFVLAAPR